MVKYYTEKEKLEITIKRYIKGINKDIQKLEKYFIRYKNEV